MIFLLKANLIEMYFYGGPFSSTVNEENMVPAARKISWFLFVFKIDQNVTQERNFPLKSPLGWNFKVYLFTRYGDLVPLLNLL